MKKFILDSFDKTNLYVRLSFAENEKCILIIVHGLAEYSDRYNNLAQKLMDNNITVVRYDLRGHGKSGNKKGWVESYNDYILDLKVIVRYIKANNPNTPIFILGHSMGGFIATGYGISINNMIDGIILSAAATKKPESIEGLNGIFVKILNKFAPNFKMKNNLAPLLSKDKKVVEKYKNDPLVLKRITIKLYYEFLIKGMEWLKSNIGDFNKRCLILHGESDKIIDKESSVEFYNNIKSKDKELILYEGLYHEIFNEKEKDKVIKDLIEWINERI